MNDLSRREFLFTGLGLTLSTATVPSLLDEFAAALRPGGTEVSAPSSAPPEEGAAEQQEQQDQPVSRDLAPLFLTFDDGPLPCTSRILDLLSLTRHKATFFVIGRNLEHLQWRALAVRALKEGHEIANHSYHHPDFSRISAKRARQEILVTHGMIDEVIREANVDPTRQNLYFRFPYGVEGSSSNRAACHEILAELNYRMAWWDLDTHDWRMELAWYPRPAAKVIQAFGKARGQDVVLLHDRNRTARYLPEMIKVLDVRGFASLPLSLYGSGADTGQEALAAGKAKQLDAAEALGPIDRLGQFLEGIAGRPQDAPGNGPESLWWPGTDSPLW